ncbi:MAG TPA: hypothetical protein DCY52_05425, partial [Methylococcaceae bacterium]|nr:hypothetical protein [Methylococcaceae bacterium]
MDSALLTHPQHRLMAIELSIGEAMESCISLLGYCRVELLKFPANLAKRGQTGFPEPGQAWILFI